MLKMNLLGVVMFYYNILYFINPLCLMDNLPGNVHALEIIIAHGKLNENCLYHSIIASSVGIAIH